MNLNHLWPEILIILACDWRWNFYFCFELVFFSNIFFLGEVMNDLVLEKQYFIDEVWNLFMMITFIVGHENTRQFYR